MNSGNAYLLLTYSVSPLPRPRDTLLEHRDAVRAQRCITRTQRGTHRRYGRKNVIMAEPVLFWQNKCHVLPALRLVHSDAQGALGRADLLHDETMWFLGASV